MFVKGLLVKKLFDEKLEFVVEGENVVAKKHNTTILIPGHLYRVEIDGKVYEISAKKTNDDACLISDKFEIRDCYASDDIKVTIYNSSTTAARDVKIYSVNKQAPKIDPDFLPDDIGSSGGSSEFVFNLTAASGSGATGSSVYTYSNFTLDKPFSEIKSAIDAGQSVVCCWSGGGVKVRVPLTRTNDGFWFSALHGDSNRGMMTDTVYCVMILMWSGTDIQAKSFTLIG